MVAALTSALAAQLTGLLTGAESAVSRELKPPVHVAATPPPVSIASRHEVGIGDGCGSWILPRTPQDLGPPPSREDTEAWGRWLEQNDAIDSSDRASPTGATAVDVTVLGRENAPVILTGLEFVVTRRSTTPIQGGLMSSPCGGPVDARLVYVDLDRTPARIVDSQPLDRSLVGPGTPAWQTRPVRFPYSVTDSSGEFFRIIASGMCDCTWYARLLWSAAGRNGETIIDDGGAPFRTAPGSLAKADYGFDPNQNRWFACPPARGDAALGPSCTS